MSVKSFSLLLACLALASLSLNVYKRITSANEESRCVEELHGSRREAKLLWDRVVKADTKLADLSRTIAGLESVDMASHGSDNQDIVAKINALERENKEVKEYLVMLQKDANMAEDAASGWVKTGGKLTDEINDLNESLGKLQRQLKTAVSETLSR